MTQLSLFASHPDRSPTWEDVRSGDAVLVDRIVPCYRCHQFCDGERCRITRENGYAFPRSRPGGMCRATFYEWSDDDGL